MADLCGFFQQPRFFSKKFILDFSVSVSVRNDDEWNKVRSQEGKTDNLQYLVFWGQLIAVEYCSGLPLSFRHPWFKYYKNPERHAAARISYGHFRNGYIFAWLYMVTSGR